MINLEDDDNVLDPTADEEPVEPEEEPLPNYIPIPKTTEITEDYPAKKSDRQYGILFYPKGAKVHITEKEFTFFSESAIMEFIGTLIVTKPKKIVEQVQEKLGNAPIGIAKNGKETVVVIWLEPNVRIYYDPKTGERIHFMPECIKT